MIKNLKTILKKSEILTKIYNKSKRFKLILNKNEPVSIKKNIVENYNRTRKPFVIKSICHAPYTSLLIGIDGKYRVCCYNVEYVLGDILQNTMSEVWFGEKIKILRKKIDNYDFSAGCYLCKSQLEQGAFQTLLAKNYDEFKISSKKYPQIIEFEMSNTCNLECIMCTETYSSKIEHRLDKINTNKSKIDENKFIEELVEFIPHLKKAKFTGGEPFLIKTYYKIWELLRKLNPKCEITIQTNGTILNDEIKSILENGKFNIIISVDSLKKDNFEHIRKNGNFESFYNNLLWFISFCKREKRFVGFTTCLMRQNWMEMPNIISFCNNQEISITFNKVYQPPNCAIWGSSYSYIKQVNNYLNQIVLPSDNYIEYNNFMAFNDLKNLISEWENEAKTNEEFYRVYNELSCSELEESIFDKINNSLKKHFDDAENITFITIIQNSLYLYKDNPNYKKLLIELIKIPEEIIIREVSNNSQSQLLKQLENYLNKIQD
ncbi:MAG: radical SAM protein [Acholeplasma sp.]|nr:radical SAM protein [Acholeplasma sp.]